MKNLWIQRHDAFAIWYADATSLLDAPEKLVSLLKQVYEAMMETHLGIPSDFDPVAELMHRWEAERVIDVFPLSSERLAADLAWFSSDGRLVEGRVADLGKLLATLEPKPNSIHLDRRVPGLPPVEFKGGRIAYVGMAPSPRPAFGERFSITLRSDIWFPYVLGLAHPNCDCEHYFDNRELAKCHTPRLNTLLRTIRNLMTAAGGSLELDRSDVNPLYEPWLSNDGISLDGPQPLLMPAGLSDVEWPQLQD